MTPLSNEVAPAMVGWKIRSNHAGIPEPGLLICASLGCHVVDERLEFVSSVLTSELFPDAAQAIICPSSLCVTLATAGYAEMVRLWLTRYIMGFPRPGYRCWSRMC